MLRIGKKIQRNKLVFGRQTITCKECGFSVVVDMKEYQEARYVECPICGRVLKYVPIYAELDDVTGLLLKRGYNRNQTIRLKAEIEKLLEEKPKMKDNALYFEIQKEQEPLYSLEWYHQNRAEQMKKSAYISKYSEEHPLYAPTSFDMMLDQILSDYNYFKYHHSKGINYCVDTEVFKKYSERLDSLAEYYAKKGE